MFTTAGKREAHAVAVQPLLVRNASLRTNDELIEQELRADPAFRSEWNRVALGRVVATTLVQYRAEHDLSQRALADKLRVTRIELAQLEVGDVNPSDDTLTRISTELGIVFTTEVGCSPDQNHPLGRMIVRKNTPGPSQPIR